MSTLSHLVYNLLLFLQLVTGVSLVAVVTMQESKNEGLTGQIGTTASTSFKGKAGREEQLNLVTRNIATVFFVLCILVAIVTARMGR